MIPGAIPGETPGGGQERPRPADPAEFTDAIERLRAELARTVVGQEEVITQVLAAILSEGHCLLVGVPGLAKTLLVRALASLLSLEFRRIQFTPDLMPSDITGTTLIQDAATGERGYRFLRGPIFSHVLLADEINRTPPKTQAALMEAMEEGQVTAGGRRMTLDRPFFVLATQNPIEQEGTYPLPVSQLDRFLFEIHVDYPSCRDEFRVVQRTTALPEPRSEPILARDEILRMIAAASSVAVPARLLDYATRIVRGTRPDQPSAPPGVVESVAWGAGPRAVQALISGGRALALLAGRNELTADDLHRIVAPALRHRIVLSYHAEAEGVRTDDVLSSLLESMPDGLYRAPDRDRDAEADSGWRSHLPAWLRRR